MNETVTYYSSHKSKMACPVRLERVLYAFKMGRFASEISKVRDVLVQQGEIKYREAKRTLPAIAFCGEFSGGHGKGNLVKYNGLLVFDVDHLSEEEMGRARACLVDDEYILAFWVSPSGNGYKGLIRIDYQNVPEGLGLDSCYKKAFADVAEYFNQCFGIEFDTNCSDFSRICYVCWDENLFVNDNATHFVVDCEGLTQEEKNKGNSDKIVQPKTKANAFKPVNVAGKNTQHARDVISSIIKYLSKRGLSITHSYDEWLRVGFAIASTFNYDLGEKYFIALSKLDKDKYNETICIEKLQECYMSGKGEVGLGTIVEMARSKGYKGSSEDM